MICGWTVALSFIIKAVCGRNTGSEVKKISNEHLYLRYFNEITEDVVVRKCLYILYDLFALKTRRTFKMHSGVTLQSHVE